jgi:hypothetical protein
MTVLGAGNIPALFHLNTHTMQVQEYYLTMNPTHGQIHTVDFPESATVLDMYMTSNGEIFLVIMNPISGADTTPRRFMTVFPYSSIATTNPIKYVGHLMNPSSGNRTTLFEVLLITPAAVPVAVPTPRVNSDF